MCEGRTTSEGERVNGGEKETRSCVGERTTERDNELRGRKEGERAITISARDRTRLRVRESERE